MRRQVFRHDRLVVWILVAWHDTTCSRKVCILHQTRVLSVYQNALRLVQCICLILSAHADHPLRSLVRVLHLILVLMRNNKSIALLGHHDNPDDQTYPLELVDHSVPGGNSYHHSQSMSNEPLSIGVRGIVQDKTYACGIRNC